ncbi:MAG TPA: YoaK family protein [Rhodoferax sp.]|nr:YoaK family protein [Rhodoferax sp.]
MFPLIRGWADVVRTPRTNVRLGAVLALVAGAANAGGFLAVGQYTSHMTGVVSSVADHLVLGDVALALTGVGSYLAFVLGAMTTAVLVNWGLRRQLRSAYGLPLLLEALLLLVFGVFGAVMSVMVAVFVPLTVVLLCFMMGLQNAVITKISKAEIRTTHVTGLTTDLGIELGKLLYVNRGDVPARVLANRHVLRLHGLLIACFFTGGVLGALGFRSFGYATTVPLALMLLLLVARPVLDDLRRRRQEDGSCR